MSIGERISTLRKEQNISQVQLANALNVTRQAVSKWENDQTSPDTVKLIQLAEVLNTEVEYLATGVHPVYQEAPIVVNMVEKVDKVIEKVVEKPVVKKVTRVKYLRNPVEFILVGAACFIIGIVIGLIL
jgi:transcriptional regulator with XRE-family HTH domain